VADPAEKVRDALVAAVVEPFREAWQELDRVAWPGFTAAVERATAAHRELLETHPDELDVGYRSGVNKQVLAPLILELSRSQPGKAPLTLLDAAEQRARTACGGLASEARLSWVEGSLDAYPGDSGARRMDKILLRVSRRLRPKRERPPVPVRAVGWYLLTEESAYAQRRAFADAQRAFASTLAALERAWGVWADAFLRRGDGDEADDDGEERADPREVAERLEAALELAVAHAPHEAARDHALEDLDRVEGLVASELPLAGTIAFRPGMEPLAPRTPRDPGPSAIWSQWCLQAIARLDLVRALLDVTLGCDALVDAFRARLRAAYREQLVDRCVGAETRIRELGRRIADAAGRALVGEVTAVRQGADEQIAAVLEALPTASAFEASVRAAADATAESLHALARNVPATVELHDIPGPEGAPQRPDEGRVLRLQDAARQAFDVLRMERIRTRPLAVVEGVEAVLGDRDRFGEVVAFGCDSAQQELEAGGDDAEERARTLVGEGLERAADAIAAVPPALDAAVEETRTGVAEEVRGGWSRLVERALAQRMEGRYLDLRSRIVASLGDLRDRIAPRVRDGSRRMRLAFARLRRVLSRLLRRGRSLVGASEASPRPALGTMRVLSEPERLLEGLPLVYQRLFSLAPVSDPGLLAGREVQLGDVEARWRRWRDHEGIPVVVVGRPGAGVSSFFLVAVQRLEGLGAHAAHRVLDRRYHEEAELANALSETLGIDPVDSLEGLAASVLSAPDGAVPDFVALEGIEHLYLRIPGGTDLIERLLTLTAETEPRIFWLLSVTQSAWQLVQKSEPTAVSQVDPLPLAPLDAAGLRAAILARHRRSGVPLSYVEPTEGRRLLRRRLRQLRGTAGHQKVLEDDFFERLHRSSGGNVRFALFEWLRAADFSTAEGQLRVRPLEPMDFSFLEGLALTQNFSLKALLEHRTLTLDEHDKIFRLPRQESYQIFESLRNRHLIEATEDGVTEEIVGVGGESRYRLVPLLTGAAAAHLARRNILH
jgi:hypothetical protein